ncbi:MAG: hypothetical protein BA870_00565 [Desulfuromonadales bacterium C00003094]|jgi:hypothetical protein|nr:MAG: hypothetical protein BA870_00565 [Desulfuromonadales bacterium C00003094]OEU76381.1 MAG: hypothetical protein BA869_02570 [Desulfuromonadales bacterium C00003107]
MFFLPLNQPESVALVIHSLRVAGGEADCSTCPVRRVCMKQCLTIANSLQQMIDDGTLPSLEEDTLPEEAPLEAPAELSEAPQPSEKGGHLKIIK